jgi:hypothetical protein
VTRPSTCVHARLCMSNPAMKAGRSGSPHTPHAKRFCHAVDVGTCPMQGITGEASSNTYTAAMGVYYRWGEVVNTSCTQLCASERRKHSIQHPLTCTCTCTLFA